ncbi:hypothetical protein [Cohnella sp.]|uniref:hypothetical protein n=1 Tax=Cohnella sp. TaxID=1883426 RepID=UPI003704A671
MSQYLTLDEADKPYFPNGVTPELSDILRASAIIDAHCRREIGAKSYTERIPLTELQRGHLSYSPVIDVTEVKGRPRNGIMGGFFGPPGFEDVDISNLDVDPETGSVWCGGSPFGIPYAELAVTYTSGWDSIPKQVKVACGLIVGKITGNPDSNVKSKKDFDFSIEYFGSGMITPEIADLLSAYCKMSMR